MAVATLQTLVGHANSTGSDRALHLRVWSGEVLTAFEKTTVMRSLVTTRRITSGKSATFPILGRAKAVNHLPGENILTESTGATYLSEILANERLILIDNTLISAVLVNDLDEAMSHYEVRAPFTSELGRALANQFDIDAMAKLFATASEASLLTGSDEDPTGTTLTLPTAAEPSGAVWAGAFWDAASAMDVASVPRESRFFLCPPQVYYSLINTTEIQAFINRDFAGMGSLPGGQLPRVAGFTIINTEQFPITNLSQRSGDLNDYGTDMSLALGCFGHETAIGQVQLLDTTVQAEYKIEYQGNLVVARYASGIGTLRPASVVALGQTTPRFF